METKRVPHPTDLLDREGFLRFLNHQAHQGWAAESIGVFSTTFRKTDTPPRGYTMTYHRAGDVPYVSKEGYHGIPCSVEGFFVYPTDEILLPDPTWPEQVLGDLDKVPTLAFGNRLQTLPFVLPVVVLLNLFGLNRWGTTAVEGLAFWGLLALCLVTQAGVGLMYWVEHGYAQGLRAARDRKTVFRPGEKLTKLTWLKNRLIRVQTGLCILTFLLYLVLNGIASGSIRF